MIDFLCWVCSLGLFSFHSFVGGTDSGVRDILRESKRSNDSVAQSSARDDHWERKRRNGGSLLWWLLCQVRLQPDESNKLGTSVRVRASHRLQ